MDAVLNKVFKLKFHDCDLYTLNEVNCTSNKKKHTYENMLF